MKKNVIRALLILLLIADMVFIFYNSAQVASASSDASQSITQIVAPVIVPNYNALDEASRLQTVASLEAVLRETAHLLQFVPMGFALYLLLCTAERCDVLRRFRFLITVGLGFLYAVSDEVHQLFVPGRSFQLFDIFMDTSGVVIGCVIATVIIKISNKVFNKKHVTVT